MSVLSPRPGLDLVEVFRLAGYANQSFGYYVLFPCSLGTYVNISIVDDEDFSEKVKCLECPAGRFVYYLYLVHIQK